MKTSDLILNYIKGYFEKHCYVPSYDEIIAEVGIGKSTLYGYMKRFFRDGLLENDFDDDFSKPRAFRPKGYICIKEESHEETKTDR